MLMFDSVAQFGMLYYVDTDYLLKCKGDEGCSYERIRVL